MIIRQKCQKINITNILKKKFHASWFFTNERSNKFLLKLTNFDKIKKVFAIGSSGDFAFSLLCLLNIDQMNLCDTRPVSNLTIDLKQNLFKKLNYNEILNLFLNYKSCNKEQVYKRINQNLNPLTKALFDKIIYKFPLKNFIKCLRQSGFWYKYSFSQIKHKQDYLLYLKSQKNYKLLKSQLNKISLFCGDFIKNLKLFSDKYYNLIYVSNILDSRKYIKNNPVCLKIIHQKLVNNGFLMVVAQSNWKKMKKFIEGFGFEIVNQETHRLNPFSSIFGHYSYSFLLFKKVSDIIISESN